MVLRMPTEPADLEFWRLVVDEERSRHPELPIDFVVQALASMKEPRGDAIPFQPRSRA